MDEQQDNPARHGLLAVDVGNTRTKLGWFPAVDPACVRAAGSAIIPIAASRLPEPASTIAGTPEELAGRLVEWLDEVIDPGAPARAAFASVSRPAAQLVRTLLGDAFLVRELRSELAPIEMRVDEPTRIGVDRVMAAVAANRLRWDATPAIVVDVGTAITVDLIAANGALEGGAILPGPRLAALALAERTDGLPVVPFGDLDITPDAVGKSTEPAIRAGLFWGAVGAIRELIARQRDRLTTPPQVFLTGGAAASIARLIGGPDLAVRHVPHLTLAGIAVAAEASPSE